MIKFIILGNPISSKNSIRSGITKDGRNYTYVKKDIKDYRDNALKQLNSHIDDGLNIVTYGKSPKFVLNDINGISYHISIPITEFIEASFLFYCIDNRKRDLVNLIQCPCDLLQQAGIILNDYLIISLDGSRIMPPDKDNSRTEIYIKTLKEE